MSYWAFLREKPFFIVALVWKEGQIGHEDYKMSSTLTLTLQVLQIRGVKCMLSK